MGVGEYGLGDGGLEKIIKKVVTIIKTEARKETGSGLDTRFSIIG